MWKFIKKQPTSRIIACGFALVILLGSALLIMPFSVKEGVDLNYIDALYTSTSAVCVTGLISVDAGDTFTTVGQIILALLIQVGGLGVTAVGAGFILMLGKKMNLKSQNLIHEAMNLDLGKKAVTFIRDIFVTTLIIELIGAILSFVVFVQDFELKKAIGVSLFHSIAAFNNSGFDIFGGMQNLQGYHNNVLLNLVTCGLIFFGGIGFLVIKEVITKKFRWKKFSMHAKVVLTMSAVLIVVGTLLIKLTEKDATWLEALFHSVSARTAGFSTRNLGQYSSAALFVITFLMFVGASPGSTGGGIKTTTMFVLCKGIGASATNRSEKAFKYSIPKDAFKKASVITLLALLMVTVATLLMLVFEQNNPQVQFDDAMFECVSAFGTVGLSTGITPNLSVWSKLLSILMMFVGRLGPLTIATMWHFSHGKNVTYPEGNIAIG